MNYTRSLQTIRSTDVPSAGGKGASLGEMMHTGIPVPHGFVITVEAFDRFLVANRLHAELESILDSVHIGEMHTVEHASEQIRALMKSGTMPADIAHEIVEQFTALNASHVAVRSSATAEDGATAAWAGQLETFLNTTEDTLLEYVQDCWASLFTPRAIFYRKQHAMHDQKVAVAVVVQAMIQSEVSGIAFSVHPITEDYNQLIIEASYGLGEAIVSGLVTPDSYVVEKTPRRIIEKTVATKIRALMRATPGGNEWVSIPEPKASSAALRDESIISLSEMILRIERQYGFPCDIEWAYADGSFFITQSRPITTLS